MCLPVNQKHLLSLISTVVLKLKDFWRSQAVTHTVKAVFWSWKRMYLLQRWIRYWTTPHVSAESTLENIALFAKIFAVRSLGTIDEQPEQVAEMTKHGVVEPAASPVASNVVLDRKKDGTLRFCVDYRQLKQLTVHCRWLTIVWMLSKVRSDLVHSLNIPSGYYNIPIANEKDKDKTAFVTRSGCHRFTVTPLDLTGAPSIFERFMDFVSCGLSYVTCLLRRYYYIRTNL